MSSGGVCLLLITCLSLAGCGVRDPYDHAQPPSLGEPDEPSVTPQGRHVMAVAVRYARAARGYDAQTLGPNHDTQLRLASGQLLEQLRAVGPPRQAEIQAVGRARSAKRVEVLTTDVEALSERGARVKVVLSERTVELGALSERTSINTVRLDAGVGRGWRVNAFFEES